MESQPETIASHDASDEIPAVTPATADSRDLQDYILLDTPLTSDSRDMRDGLGLEDSPVIEDGKDDESLAKRSATFKDLVMSNKSRWTSDEQDATTKAANGDVDQLPSVASRAIRFEEAEEGSRRTSSFGTTVSSMMMTNRRTAAAAAAAAAAFGGSGSKKGKTTFTDAELRRFVFQYPRSKRLVSGLRVHAFTRQAFVSSFTVGVVIGSVIAIAFKILIYFGYRVLYS